jgi:hypothetical protein
VNAFVEKANVFVAAAQAALELLAIWGLAQLSQRTVPLGIATEVTYQYEIMLKALALSQMKRAPLRTPLSR